MAEASYRSVDWQLRVWLVACTGSNSLYPQGERAVVYASRADGLAMPKHGVAGRRRRTARVSKFSPPELDAIRVFGIDRNLEGVVTFSDARRDAA